jgi:dTDP-4-amino-4,6-dideoxygalactose transaminase
MEHRMTTVPFLDLGAAYRELQQDIEQAALAALRSGWYIGGPEVEAFEAEFAAYCGAGSCIGVGNGLDALRLALLALDVGPGDEVIVPSNTFIATWLAVSQCGAVPVPVEPDSQTCNMDPARIEAALSSRTRAIIPVHLYGQPADLDLILDIARRHGLCVIEDAAQAQGSRYKGARIGAHSDAVAWSFYPGKNLGALGDAGAVTTSSPQVAERIRLLRNYGSREKYVHEVQGMNTRLDPVQAAVLRVKLKHLDEWNTRRRSVAAQYTDSLGAIGGLRVPHVPDWCEPAWHLYVVQHERRDELRERLGKRGVGTLIHYPVPPHRQGAYRTSPAAAADFPIADRLAAQVLSLPIGPQMSEADVQTVVEALRVSLS